MTDEELVVMERACAAATPGPWGIHPDPAEISDLDRDAPLTDESMRRFSAFEENTLNGSAWSVGPICGYDGDALGTTPDDPDLLFVAGARSWVPALVSEVRRLRQSVEAEREACAELADETAESWGSVRYPDVSEDGHRWAARSAKSIASAVRARGGG